VELHGDPIIEKSEIEPPFLFGDALRTEVRVTGCKSTSPGVTRWLTIAFAEEKELQRVDAARLETLSPIRRAQTKRAEERHRFDEALCESTHDRPAFGYLLNRAFSPKLLEPSMRMATFRNSASLKPNV